MKDDYYKPKRVKTPMGMGEVISTHPIDQTVLVILRREDFTPEVWQRISPHGGEFIFRVFEVSEVKSEFRTQDIG